jgi:hypothetical protein
MRVAIRAKVGAVTVAMLPGTANAAEINVIASPGTQPYTLLVPSFQEATGTRVTTTWAESTRLPTHR